MIRPSTPSERAVEDPAHDAAVKEFLDAAHAAGYTFRAQDKRFRVVLVVKPNDESIRATMRAKLETLKSEVPDADELIWFALRGEEHPVRNDRKELFRKAEARKENARARAKAAGAFVQAPVEMLYNAGLSDGAFRLALHVRNVSRFTDRFWEARRTTAQALDLSKRQISRRFQELESSGIVEVAEEGSSLTKHYRVHWPDLAKRK